MKPEILSPLQASQLLEQGAVLVDIRDRTDYLREHIPQAISLPLTEMTSGKTVEGSGDQPVIFHCQAGMRTTNNADKLMIAVSSGNVFLMSGGINEWKDAALPTVQDKKQPLPIIRQVHITAGTLVLLGVILGYAVDSRLFLLSGFIGAGLVFSGVSGLCGMASVLQNMPWNRPAK
ncbi:rhodanese family protein [Pantoea agglomerans]|uniref:rhodanese family protein n=1 Tax=Enterobacter agglomerans TaxID=549 RepID=UPI0007E57DFD|nr:rhodanese family protein [Pantoea agglomerans]WHU89983.1 rhodanese family protein [Pantoea agglomerans pv. gypsophilae]WNN36621.1 rhodanese family protein [Pantoea agglomerans]